MGERSCDSRISPYFTILSVTMLLISFADSKSGAPCQVECKAYKKAPVCASDGLSYPTKCEVRRQRICLKKKNLEVLYEGECFWDANQAFSSGAPDQSPSTCEAKRQQNLRDQEQRSQMLPGSNKEVNDIMVYECTSTGLFKKVQCMRATGYCWCVNQHDGMPISGTSIQHEEPDCDTDNLGESGASSEADDCNDAARSLFNSNLHRYLSERYLPRNPRKQLVISSQTRDIAALAEATFHALDNNTNKILSSKELRQIKRSVKQEIKPKMCARNFVDYCDRNQNGEITPDEWRFCLGDNTNLSFHLFLSLNADSPPEAIGKGWGGSLPSLDESSKTENDNNPPELMEDQRRLFNMLDTGEERGNSDEQGANAKGSERIDKNPLNDHSNLDSELVSLSTRTCMDERRSALMKGGDYQIQASFIPLCQSDGRYEPTQCHSLGYCWCVNVNTGVPIPGTSKFKRLPTCKNAPANNAHTASEDNNQASTQGSRKKPKKKEIPGCPSPHHPSFLSQLVDALTREMAEKMVGKSLHASLSSGDMSLEEKAVRWKFMRQDRNNDANLNRREFKFVKKLSKNNSIRAPEKCTSRFMKFCDGDNDGGVSMEELLLCTEVVKPTQRERNGRRHESRFEPNIEEYGRNGNRNPLIELLTPSDSEDVENEDIQGGLIS